MPKVFTFLLDGVRYDQITEEYTPYLYKLHKGSLVIEALKKTAPFCERTEIYTGESGLTTKNFAAFIRSNGKPVYKTPVGLFSYLLDKLSFGLPSAIGGKLGYLLYRIGKKARKKLQTFLMLDTKIGGFAVNDIPFRFLSHFTLSEDYLACDNDDAFIVPTIFDTLRKNNVPYLNVFDDLRITLDRKNRAQRVNILLQSFSGSTQLYLYADSEVDAHAHIYGLDSEEIKHALIRQDKSCEELHQSFLKANPDGVTIFFSPHGMLNVSEKINVEIDIKRVAKKLQLKIGKDIFYFLDSTMVRVWGEHADQLMWQLQQLNHWKEKGKFLDRDSCTEMGITKSVNEAMWIANPGICIFPDFFRRFSPPKGMHGYSPNNSGMDGFAICNGKGITSQQIKEAYLKNIRWTMEDLLDINKDKRSWLSDEDK